MMRRGAAFGTKKARRLVCACPLCPFRLFRHGRSGNFGSLLLLTGRLEQTSEVVADPLGRLRRVGYVVIQNGNLLRYLMGQLWINDNARCGSAVPQHLLEFANQFGSLSLTGRLRRLLVGFVPRLRYRLDLQRFGC